MSDICSVQFRGLQVDDAGYAPKFRMIDTNSLDTHPDFAVSLHSPLSANAVMEIEIPECYDERASFRILVTTFNGEPNLILYYKLQKIQ